MESRACPVCGTSMKLFRASAVTCSARCRKQWSRRPTIPAEMTSRDRWMRWRLVERNGRQTKLPVQLNGRAASSTDSRTWTTFKAAEASPVGTGAGFALGEGIGCYDLDDALTHGALKPWASEFIESIRERVIFREVSQSGNGVHVFVEAAERPGHVIRDGRNIEFYSVGRFIAVTGVPFKS